MTSRFTSRDTWKLALAAIGIAAFLLGASAELPYLRWTGISLVAAAWLLRFVGRGGVTSQDTTTDRIPTEDER